MQKIFERIAALTHRGEPTSRARGTERGDRAHTGRTSGIGARVACPKCRQTNPESSLLCWACGLILAEKPKRSCPCCDKPLMPRTLAATAAETCDDCGGVWLGAGAIPALIRRGPEALLPLITTMGLPAGNIALAAEAGQTLHCPACEAPLEGGPYRYNLPARVDNCPKCQGTWVGAGELAEILEHHAVRGGHAATR